MLLTTLLAPTTTISVTVSAATALPGPGPARLATFATSTPISAQSPSPSPASAQAQASNGNSNSHGHSRLDASSPLQVDINAKPSPLSLPPNEGETQKETSAVPEISNHDYRHSNGGRSNSSESLRSFRSIAVDSANSNANINNNNSDGSLQPTSRLQWGFVTRDRGTGYSYMLPCMCRVDCLVVLQ